MIIDEKGIDLKSILGSIQKGDMQSYVLILDRFQRPIYLYCYYLLRNQEEAEDATQETFIKALEHIKQFNYTASFSAWLYKIARNHCTDLLKKKNREKKILDLYQMNKHQEQDYKYTDFIYECLDKLSSEERQILLLRIIEEYSYDEIAFIMDSKSVNIRKKYERIRKKLIQVKKGVNLYEQSY
ncbi:RNA polymerase sigma factor [Paenibacillus zanthoxyli]|uniref:RNA polymerase sigma factor n=1 Tax=Paenibacillus zanthoxyli TaxID=369399 RepID=UPI000472BCC5|nr:RNA polymerase sigma factor [Paenibacillus zanthoxyli]